MAVDYSHELEIGMQVIYGVQNGEFQGARYSSYPALIVGVNTDVIPYLWDIVVFTEVGVFSKTGVEEGEPGVIQAGKISMTKRQYNKEMFADFLGLNFNLFRP